MPVTGHDVARLLGLSQSTVSRALRGDPRVTEATRQRVVEAAKELGYVLNIQARNLITRRANAIALCVTSLTNPAVAQNASMLQAAVESYGYRAVLFSFPEGGAEADQRVQELLGGVVDGAVDASGVLDERSLKTLEQHGIGVVLLNRVAKGVDLDRVVSDNHSGGRAAATHLWELGHRTFGVIRSSEGSASPAPERLQGFLDALEDRGVPADSILAVEVPFSHDAACAAAADLLTGTPRPTALYCTTDLLAFGVLSAARQLGIRVPEQVSVIGYNDVPMAGWPVFDLTTVNSDFPSMVREAVQFLIDRLRGEADLPARESAHPTRLVVRSTTGRAPR
jgi:LacI family transcriptional regulator